MQCHRLFSIQPATGVALSKAAAAMNASGNAGATKRTMRDERVSDRKAARHVRKLPARSSQRCTASGKNEATAGTSARASAMRPTSKAVITAGAAQRLRST